MGRSIRLPIAHGEGNYRIDDAGLARLVANRQVLLRYAANPNGSLDDIAGCAMSGATCSASCPTRTGRSSDSIPSRDGIAFARAVLATVSRWAKNPRC